MLLASRLAGALGHFWYVQGAWREGCAWLEDALASLPSDVPGRIRIVTALGVIYASLTDLERAVQLFGATLETAPAGDDLDGAWFLHNMARCYMLRGDLAPCRPLLERALAICRAIGDPWHTELVLALLATLLIEGRDYAAAEPLVTECLALSRAQRIATVEAAILCSMSEMALDRGDFQQAIECSTEGVAIFRRENQKVGLVWALRNYGQACLALGNLDAAARSFDEALAIGRELEARDGIIINLEGMAAVAAARGEAERAGQLVGFAAAQREQLGMAMTANSQSIFDHFMRPARDTLGEAGWQMANAAGRRLTPAEVWDLVEPMP